MYRFVKVPNPKENKYTSTLITPVAEVETKIYEDGSSVWRKYTIEQTDPPQYYNLLYTTEKEDVYFPTEIRQQTNYVLREPETLQPIFENLLVTTIASAIEPYIGTADQRDIYKEKYTQAKELLSLINSNTEYMESDYSLITSSVGILADTLKETAEIIYNKGYLAEQISTRAEIERISTQNKLRNATTSQEKLDLFTEFTKFAFIKEILNANNGDTTNE